MVETPSEFGVGEPASVAAIHGAVGRDDDRLFAQRLTAFCQQLDARETERRHAPGRAVDFTEVFAARRPLASRILSGVAVVGAIAAGGTGIYLAQQDVVEAPAVPAIAQAIVAPAKAAPTPEIKEVDATPATVVPIAQPAAEVAALPDPTPPSPKVAEAAREAPATASMPPVLAAAEPSVATASGPPLDRGAFGGQDVVELQRLLNELGFGAGPVDGVVGPLTRGAIRQYQEFAGLAPTGVADADILQRLRQEAPGVATRQ